MGGVESRYHGGVPKMGGVVGGYALHSVIAEQLSTHVVDGLERGCCRLSASEQFLSLGRAVGE